MADTREHSELALSASDRWVNCPGSIFLQRNIEKAPAGPEAERGSHVHELCAIILEDFLNHKLKGTDPDIRFNLSSVNYDEEEILNAQNYKKAIWEEVLNQSITNKAWGIEEKFVFDGGLDIYGTVDFWCIYLDERAKRVVHLVDYKNGFHYVNEKCGQLKSYAAALRREIRLAGKDIDIIKVSIYQPRCVSAASFRTTTYTSKQLDVWEKKMYKAAHQIYVKKKPKFKCGFWCKWCPGKALCKAYAKEVETTIELSLVNPADIILVAPETLKDEQLSKIILNADRIEDFLSACKKYGINRHLSGTPLPGLKAVLGTQRRKWIDDEKKICLTLTNELGLSPEDVYQPPKLNTITAVERKLGKGKLEQLTELSAPKPVLVPVTDARVAIVNGLDMLEALGSDDV